MSRSKLFGKRDKNHNEIADVFASFGFSVAETSAQGNFVDLVVAKDGYTAIVEIKRIDKNISLCQLEFLAAWKGNAAIVTDKNALIADKCNFGLICLLDDEKEFLTSFCAKERYQGATDKKEYRTSRILNLLKEI